MNKYEGQDVLKIQNTITRKNTLILELEREEIAEDKDLSTKIEAVEADLDLLYAALAKKEQKPESPDHTNSNSKENRAVALLTNNLKAVETFSYETDTTEWCDKIAHLQSIYAGETESVEMKQCFYKAVCGHINTVAYSSWVDELHRTGKPGTTTDLLIFLQEHYGDKTSIYQCLSTLWTMKKEPTLSYTQTAHLMESKLAHAMATIKKTYRRIHQAELTVDAFAKIVAGMVYSELARNADAEIFRHATKDLEECFSPSEIAGKLTYYRDQFGSTDAVTVAEKAAANTFFGANPKVANAKAKNGKKGGRRRRDGNKHGSRQDRNHSKTDSKAKSNDRCQSQDFKNGCTRNNCPYRHDGQGGHAGSGGKAGNAGPGSHTGYGSNGGSVGNAYHSQGQVMSMQSTTSSPAMSSPAMMSHNQPMFTSNGPDADFHLC